MASAVDHPSELTEVVHRNIHALLEVRKKQERARTREQRVADAITRFTGSMLSVYVHAVIFGLWIVVNVGLIPFVPAFDPFPFVMLAVITSVEAIFLGTFVLMTQNRMAETAVQRAELDLQISLLSEHEVTTVLRLLDAVRRRLGVSLPTDMHLDVEDAKRDVMPEKLAEEIEKAEPDARAA